MKYVWLLICMVWASYAYAQNKTFAIGTSAPNANAALQVESPTNNQGVLLPRLTTAQRVNMTLAAADKGLIVYDITENAIFTWDGTQWFDGSVAQQIGLPFLATATTAPANSNLFAVEYNGTEVNNVGVARFENFNPNTNFSTVFTRNAGSGSAGYFQNLTNTSASAALRGITNSNNANGHGVLGLTTGTGGSGGYFQVNNNTSTTAAVTGTTNGALLSAGVYGVNTGNGFGVWGKSNGSAIGSAAVYGEQTGTGDAAGAFRINNTANVSNAIYGETNGTASAINANQIGTGRGMIAQINNAANDRSAFLAQTNGVGNGIEVNLTNTASTAVGININHSGTGNAITANRPIQATRFTGETISIAPTGGDDGLFINSASNTGGGAGISSHVNGTASTAGFFGILNAANSRDLLELYNNGLGRSILINQGNPSNANAAITIENLGTGNAITANKPIQATQFIGDGSLLTNLPSATGIAYPYVGTVTSAVTPNIDVFKLSYDNAATARGVMRIESLNAGNAGSSLSVQQKGTGLAGFFQVDNTATTSSTIWATTNSNAGGELAPVGVYGESTGTGSLGGSFRNTNTANTFPALYAETKGTSNAVNFRIDNAANTFPALVAKTNGTGSGGFFQIENAANTNAALQATTNGTGNGIAIRGDVTNTANAAAGIYGSTAGTGVGVYGITTGAGAAIQGYTATGAIAIYGRHDGATNGNAGFFEISNVGNTFSALQSNTVGTGSAGNFKINNASSSAPTVFAETNGTGNAGQFKSSNAASTGYALVGETNGAALSAGVFGNNTGTGFGVFGKSNGTAFGSAAVYGEQTGTGDAAGAFRINNASSTMSGLYGETNGSGAALFVNNLGTGRGAQIQINNASNPAIALRTYTNGTGNAASLTIDNASNSASVVKAETNGTGSAGEFNLTNASNNSPAIKATTNSTGSSYTIQATHTGTGDAFYGKANSGSAGNFQNDNASNAASTIFGLTNAANGHALGLINSGNGSAFTIFQGGMQVSVANVSTTSITTRASAYRITTTGTFTIGFAVDAGTMLMMYNDTGTGITVEGVSIPGNSGKVLINFGTPVSPVWRGI